MASKPPLYSFYQGAPFTIGRKVLSGDPAGYVVTANLLRTAGMSLPPVGTPVSATFVPSFVAAAGAEAAYWLLNLSSAVTAALARGRYVTQAHFSLNGELIEITGPAFVDVKAAG